jgi:hypothetical protein
VGQSPEKVWRIMTKLYSHGPPASKRVCGAHPPDQPFV